MTIKTASNRLKIEDLPDVFGPKEVAMALGIHMQAAYDLVKSPGFPSKRFGRKILVSKEGFIRWKQANFKETI